MLKQISRQQHRTLLSSAVLIISFQVRDPRSHETSRVMRCVEGHFHSSWNSWSCIKCMKFHQGCCETLKAESQRNGCWGNGRNLGLSTSKPMTHRPGGPRVEPEAEMWEPKGIKSESWCTLWRLCMSDVCQMFLVYPWGKWKPTIGGYRGLPFFLYSKATVGACYWTS